MTVADLRRLGRKVGTTATGLASGATSVPASAVTPDPLDPNAWKGDPAYIGAMRAIALGSANNEPTIRSKQDQLRRKLADYLPEIARRGVLDREGIGLGFEGRGMGRSTAHQDTRARQQYDEAFQRTGLQNDTAEGIADYDMQLAGLRAADAARQADAEGAAQYRQYQLESQFALPAQKPAAPVAAPVDLGAGLSPFGLGSEPNQASPYTSPFGLGSEPSTIAPTSIPYRPPATAPAPFDLMGPTANRAPSRPTIGTIRPNPKKKPKVW